MPRRMRGYAILADAAADPNLTAEQVRFLVAAVTSADSAGPSAGKVKASLTALARKARLARTTPAGWLGESRESAPALVKYFERIERPNPRRTDLWLHTEHVGPQDMSGDVDMSAGRTSHVGSQAMNMSAGRTPPVVLPVLSLQQQGAAAAANVIEDEQRYWLDWIRERTPKTREWFARQLKPSGKPIGNLDTFAYRLARDGDLARRCEETWDRINAQREADEKRRATPECW